VRGRYDLLYARVGPIHEKKGPFSCLLCVGDFFGEHEAAQNALAPYCCGERAVPLPTYFLAGPSGMPACMDGKEDGGELAPNLTCLGKLGISEVAGLKIAFASVEEGEHTVDPLISMRSAADTPGFRGVDVLLTHAWPRGWFRQLPEGVFPAELLPDRNLEDVGLEKMSELVSRCEAFHVFSRSRLACCSVNVEAKSSTPCSLSALLSFFPNAPAPAHQRTHSPTDARQAPVAT